MSDNHRLDLEFAYTSFRDSCRDLFSPEYRCRRPHGHVGAHAAGFGDSRVRWTHLQDQDLDTPLPAH
ncbi:hypothetical protein G1H11_12465 [Phytoactinopolyspora alkaliphila]|uniref:Uncharacterized protein n=1 Tax=Phytoactinopolyspora alkaliphila TaxID=1783498 RepID=A0A6N9YMC8_9ACTN|nr:hypothetical protein [Phytoactinopolyspora alkaliphila]NED96122.1 hypothetical protein [Phytoactinopolyspora alkaliphila]